MKRNQLIFWISTGLIFLMEGAMTLVYFGSEEQKAGTAHFGYPLFFTQMVSIFDIIGALVLVLPMIPARVKEWAYFGFALHFIGAAWSVWAVDGFNFGVIIPILFFIPLGLSYWTFHNMRS